MQPALTRHTNEAVLRNPKNLQVFLKREGAQLHAEPLSGCFTISVFLFSPCMRLCQSEGGVSLSSSSGDEAFMRKPFFCGLGMGEKQQCQCLTLAKL